MLGTRDCSGWTYQQGRSFNKTARIPGPVQDTKTGATSCSPPSLKGSCDKGCAGTHWKTAYGRADGPTCGVPGC